MKKLLSFVTTLFFAITTFAQVDEATITVIGTGIDEERATLQALRSAIEQTFGAFVSANTTILNDSLIQDEIVSVSTGNVKKYDKIAVATMPNGHVSVSLTATVSVNKLISFVESKGVKAEFSGSMYAANIKLFRLKIQSIQKAYELMIQQMEHIAGNMFDFLFEMSEPQRNHEEEFGDIYYFTCYIGATSNVSSANFYDLYNKTIKELKLTADDIKLCRQENIETYLDLPFDEKKHLQYQERITEAIYRAFHRYSIQEIDNPKNVYSYCKDDETTCKQPIVLGTRVTVDNNYKLHSEQWELPIWICRADYYFSEERDERDGYSYNFIEMDDNILDIDSILPQMAFKEVMDDNKNIYVSEPNLIGVHEVCVAISASSINQFQGFELVGAFAPTNALSSTSEAYWNWFIGKADHPFVKVKNLHQHPTSNRSYRSSTPSQPTNNQQTQNDYNSYRRSSSNSRSYGTYPR